MGVLFSSEGGDDREVEEEEDGSGMHLRHAISGPPFSTDWNLVPGMPNAGNTCFQNALVQALSTLPRVHAFLSQVEDLWTRAESAAEAREASIARCEAIARDLVVKHGGVLDVSDLMTIAAAAAPRRSSKARKGELREEDEEGGERGEDDTTPGHLAGVLVSVLEALNETSDRRLPAVNRPDLLTRFDAFFAASPRMFPGFRDQQDAHELLTLLFTALHDDGEGLAAVMQRAAWESPDMKRSLKRSPHTPSTSHHHHHHPHHHRSSPISPVQRALDRAKALRQQELRDARGGGEVGEEGGDVGDDGVGGGDVVFTPAKKSSPWRRRARVFSPLAAELEEEEEEEEEEGGMEGGGDGEGKLRRSVGRKSSGLRYHSASPWTKAESVGVALPVVSCPLVGVLGSAVQCLTCSHSGTWSTQGFVSLSLSLPPRSSTSLASLFGATLRGDRVSSYRCEHCHVVGEARKRQRFVRLPRDFSIHLQRRIPSPFGGWQKVTTPVDFPLLLDMEPFFNPSAAAIDAKTTTTIEGDGDGEKVEEKVKRVKKEGRRSRGASLLYDLMAVVVHSGHANGGHFTVYRRVPRPIMPQDLEPTNKFQPSSSTKSSKKETEDEGKSGERSKEDGDGEVEVEVEEEKVEEYEPRGAAGAPFVFISDKMVRPAPIAEVLRAEAYLLFYSQRGGTPVDWAVRGPTPHSHYSYWYSGKHA